MYTIAKGKRSLNLKGSWLEYIVIFLVAFICAYMVLASTLSSDGYAFVVSSEEASLSSTDEYALYRQTLDDDKISFPGAVILPIIDSRNQLPMVLEAEQKQIGVEVGVKTGNYARLMLSQWHSCERYYLVDPWEHQTNYKDHANVDQSTQNEFMDTTKSNLADYESKTVFLRHYSVDAAPLIDDNSVDFVYLDARHDYKAVTEDLELFWPKLKKGGIYAGHDYVNANEVGGQDWCTFADGSKCTHNRAVKAAVDEFARKVQRQVVITRKEMNWFTWYMRK